jgi:chemotaxis protein MotB
VANFLVAQGLDRRRLATVGYGENHPLATNATPEGRAANRRVVIVVARKLNTDASDGRGFAFAAVRAREQAETPEMQRTSTGGLLFSNDPADSEPDASR